MKKLDKGNLIVAMDNLCLLKVEDFIKNIGGGSEEIIKRVTIKINDLLIEQGMQGIVEFIKSMETEGFDTSKINWMFDPKWNDIPNTVANYFQKLKDKNIQNVDFITIMASGGKKMMETAVKKRNALGLKTKILAVTVLTSFDDKGVKEVYNEGTMHEALKLTKLALESGVDGIVCSSLEAPILREVFGDKYDFEIVTPGIRLEGQEVSEDDQKRTKTPKDAINSGSSHLVVGRPIVQSPDKIETIKEILKQMDEAEYIEPKEKKFVFEKLLYTGNWKELLEYIGAIYRRPAGGPYVRLASKLISDGYVNIGVTERSFRILERASNELSDIIGEKIKGISPDIVMGAQMGSVRLSLTLAKSLGIEESIYTEKKGDDMILDRHDVDLTGKNVIISEDVITKLSTSIKMIELIEKRGGKVIAISCIANRSGKDNYKGIPIVSCYVPEPFGMYYDNKSLEKMEDNLDDEKIISLTIDGIEKHILKTEKLNKFSGEIRKEINKFKTTYRKTVKLIEVLGMLELNTDLDIYFDKALEDMMDNDGILLISKKAEVIENPKDEWNKLTEAMKNS